MSEKYTKNLSEAFFAFHTFFDSQNRLSIATSLEGDVDEEGEYKVIDKHKIYDTGVRGDVKKHTHSLLWRR